MRKADAESLESIFRSVMKGLKDVNAKVHTVNDKVLRLEAENKELRSLWIENEGDIIKQKVRLDRLFHALEEATDSSNLTKPTGEHFTNTRASSRGGRENK